MATNQDVTTRTSVSTELEQPASSASGARRTARRLGLISGATVLAAAFAAAAALSGSGAAGRADAAVLTNCAAKPSACGYPDATNSGVPSGMTLKTVPSQVSSGPGWSYNAAGGDVVVTGNGTVLSGLYIPYNVVIEASNVTVNDVQVVVNGGNFGISLAHTTNVTIENSTISGLNSTTGRVGYAIDDVYGDSTGMVINANNISYFKTAIQMNTGLIENNYIHDPGYVSGDHTNGIFDNGGTEQMTIENNTILNNLSQTDDISLDAESANAPVANKTIENNFLAGGSYSIYGGNSLGNTISNIVIEGNRFGQLYYSLGGQYGPDAYFATTGTGNVWSGNVWDTTGAAISKP
jgi:Right handed beta helix region